MKCKECGAGLSIRAKKCWICGTHVYPKRKTKRIRKCRVSGCNKPIEYEAIKRNGQLYAQPFGYCEEHKTIWRVRKLKKVLE